MFQGSWYRDNMSGQGTYKWANGDVYVGNFENDVKHGQGNFTYADGR